MEIGNIQSIDIDDEMQAAYLSYAMSVIVSRALPDARDGLKPVHRRILYAMHDMGINPQSTHKKSARIVGEVLGKYHPHGDQAVYDAMARMTQDFSMRLTLLDGQGNFGSMDGDTPAAMRYTEARLHPISTQLLADIEKDTVEYVNNFDDTIIEPQVLPAAFPNLMVNGSTGIAVGMSTSIPPHNLAEVCKALELMLNNWTNLDQVQTSDLMNHIQGPDFPTGGLVINDSNDETLASAYGSGRGKITVRARVHIEELSRGRQRVIVTELPYQTNKSSLISRIANLVRDNRIQGITDLRDESDRQGLRIVIDLNKTVSAEKMVDQLFKYTPLQTTFSIILLALVNGEPRLLTLKQLLKVFIEHRIEIIQRRSKYELNKAKDRAHIISGLLIALDNIDQVITLIRKSKTVIIARKNLMDTYDLSTIQAHAILNMPLKQLSRLQSSLLKEEYQELDQKIDILKSLIKSPKKIREQVSIELKKVSKKYSDHRRTHILKSTNTSNKILAPDENSWVILTKEGNITRINSNKKPSMNGYHPISIMKVNSNDILYLIANNGTASSITVGSIPLSDKPQSSVPVDSISAIKDPSTVVTMMSTNSTHEGDSNHQSSLLIITRNGSIKKLLLQNLPGPSASLFTIAKINKNDQITDACWTKDNNDIMIFSSQGKAIRFKSNTVRNTGLTAGTINGIKLKHKSDHAITCLKLEKNDQICIVSNTGKIKRTKLDDYPIQGRGGSGVQACKLDEKQTISKATIIKTNTEQIVLISSRKKSYIINITEVPLRTRAASGSQLVSLGKKEVIDELILYSRSNNKQYDSSDTTPTQTTKRSKLKKNKKKKQIPLFEDQK